MDAEALLDTGAIIAILDRSDRWHSLCVDSLNSLRLPLLTSEAVLTEVFHLLSRSRLRMDAAWTFVRSGVVRLGVIDTDELDHLRHLMSRYSDRPMDFADATLVYLAARESISAVLTVDQADFETYRISGQRRFQILPAHRP